MNRNLRYTITTIFGGIGLLLLIALTLRTPPDPALLVPGLLFSGLILFTMIFSVPLGEGLVSLMPMTAIAATLVIGSIPAAWAAVVAAVLHGLIRSRWAERLQIPSELNPFGLLALMAANASMHSLSILGAGAAFHALGGEIPLRTITIPTLVPLLALGLAYLVINYLLAGAYIAMRGRRTLTRYLQAIPNMLLFEGVPMFLALLTALIYTRLGLGIFLLFAMAMVAASLVSRDLALARRRLERRVRELSSLHAVGQALGASLDLDTVLSTIHTQVADLMPAGNFYVALYNRETSEVSFPLAIEDGQPVTWPARRTGQGMTEHILQTHEPLLIPRDIPDRLAELGLESIGRTAASWLGVPILAGDEPLGVIAVQSYDAPNTYDASHQEMLVTLAAHAAVAIQNAHLYARTDEALAQRVQELNSILRTAREGILLVDVDGRVLTANRALAEFLSIPQAEMNRYTLSPAGHDGLHSLYPHLGYTAEDLQADWQELSQEKVMFKQEEFKPSISPQRYLQRTLTPVRDREGAITGWLLFLRDRTEEHELAHLREELTHMLIHDLRSPLSVIQSSLEMMELYLLDGDPEEIERPLELARRGSQRMLHLIDQLLDISRLESGQMPLECRPVDARDLLDDVASRFTVMAESNRIQLDVEATSDLPPLFVDPGLMGRVVTNLVDNAIKFTPDGGHIRLWARFDPQSAPDTLLLGVTDNGHGIPGEALPRLFKKFQKVTSRRGRRSGTSLGLPFCKLAVEAHGGRIWVESDERRGSTFTILLPIAIQDEHRR